MAFHLAGMVSTGLAPVWFEAPDKALDSELRHRLPPGRCRDCLAADAAMLARTLAQLAGTRRVKLPSRRSPGMPAVVGFQVSFGAVVAVAVLGHDVLHWANTVEVIRGDLRQRRSGTRSLHAQMPRTAADPRLRGAHGVEEVPDLSREVF